MAIITKQNFVGNLKLGFDNYSQIENYISDVEFSILNKLLGEELYTLFIADLTTINPKIPQEQRFLDLFNPFFKELFGCNFESRGIPRMLTGFVFFYYGRDNEFEKTPTGFKTNKNDNSSEYKGSYSKLINAYNTSVNDFKAIQAFIYENLETYTEFKGVEIEYIN